MTGEHRAPSSNPSVVPERAWLASLFMRHHERFFPRLIAAVARLRLVPRGLRRRLQRKAAVTLAGAALILALGAANFGPPGANVVHAATITVANGEINLDPGNGACSLIEAVYNANDINGIDHSGGDCVVGSGAGSDTIILPNNGSFTFVEEFENSYGSNGLPTISSEITIEGNGSNIDLGGPSVGIRLVNVTSTGDLTISDTTIINGYMHDNVFGGGIFRVAGGALTVNYSTLQNSETNSYGGAIFVLDGGTLNVTNESIITGNEAFRGGGINTKLAGDVYVTLSTVSYNYAERAGGGIFAYGNGSLNISHSTITQNVTSGYSYGGGIAASGVSLDIFGSTISYNKSGNSGGGIIVRNSDDVSIDRSTINNNFVYGGGGGITWGGFTEGGLLPITGTITNSTISGNEAGAGGGIIIHLGDLTLNNVTMTGNSAEYSEPYSTNSAGGGLLVDYYSIGDEGTSSVTLNRTIISGNSSGGEGHEVYVVGLEKATVTANNFNLFGHSGTDNADAFYNFTPGATDITATSDGTESTALSDILESNLQVNAFSVTQALPDPITQTHALTENSPAVDRAPSAACTAAPIGGIDQRGEPRNTDIPGVGNDAGPNLCDIGAYELQSSVSTLGICPADAAVSEWTDILGTGMGSPKKHKNLAKVTIPNWGDVVSLYGQLAGNDDGKANYVRFMYPTKATPAVQVNTVTSPAPRSAATFWYGADLDPAPHIRGRWFLQPNGAKKHIPRALVLYPTYQTGSEFSKYVNIFQLFQTEDTQVHWNVEGGWTPSRQILVELPPPSDETTLTVKLALVGNDKDNRPVYLTVSAGGVSQTLQPTKPDRGDQLNILTFTLDIPAYTDEIVIDILSPSPGSFELTNKKKSGQGSEGDSAALIGMTANYFCDIPG